LFLLHHSSRTLEESEWSRPTISSCSRCFIARGDAHANEENVHKQLCMCMSVWHLFFISLSSLLLSSCSLLLIKMCVCEREKGRKCKTENHNVESSSSSFAINSFYSLHTHLQIGSLMLQFLWDYRYWVFNKTWQIHLHLHHRYWRVFRLGFMPWCRVETMRIYLHSHVCNLPRLLIGALLSDFKGSICSALQPL
jgi:hypothetical protein